MTLLTNKFDKNYKKIKRISDVEWVKNFETFIHKVTGFPFTDISIS